MLRTSLFCVSLAFLSTVNAFGQLDLKISRLSGLAEIHNLSDETVAFSGYSVLCSSNCLESANYISIADRVAADPLEVIRKFGAGALAFGEAGISTAAVSELNVASGARLMSLDSFSLGQIFNPANVCDAYRAGEIRFDALGSDNNLLTTHVSIFCIPEPSATGASTLLSLAATVIARRRNRR